MWSGHRTALIALCVCLGGCNSCQRESESPGATQHSQPATGAAQAGTNATPQGHIGMPTVGRGVDLAAPPTRGAMDAPPDEPTIAEPFAQGDCVVIIDADPDFGEPPLAVNFSVEAQCTSGTPTFTWDFGDGSPSSTDAAPVHTYQKAGEYTVTLKAVAPDGTQAADDIAITVEETVGQ
jgi:hypothetical protein